jgi:hypothetical protein
MISTSPVWQGLLVEVERRCMIYNASTTHLAHRLVFHPRPGNGGSWEGEVHELGISLLLYAIEPTRKIGAAMNGRQATEHDLRVVGETLTLADTTPAALATILVGELVEEIYKRIATV